jgi:hypothetical protein
MRNKLSIGLQTVGGIEEAGIINQSIGNLESLGFGSDFDPETYNRPGLLSWQDYGSSVVPPKPDSVYLSRTLTLTLIAGCSTTREHGPNR